MQDDVAATRRIEHDLGFFQRRQVIVEPPHFYRLRRHETMAIGDIAGGNAANFEIHDLRVFGLRPEGGENGMQRTHPSQAIGVGRTDAPAHRLGPREGLDDIGQDFGENVERRSALALDHRDVELPALLVRLDPRLIERGETSALEKTLNGGLGRPTRGPFFSSRWSGWRVGRPTMFKARRRGVAKLVAAS